MTKSELLEIINNGENSGVEFKSDKIRPEKLAKEVVALSNLSGGVILIGVEDDGTISGIQRSNLEEWVMDTVFGRYVHPLIIPYYEEVQMDDGKRVGVISLSIGISKPYVVKSNDREDVYVRVGSVSRIATREQQARLYAMGGMLHTETMPVPGSTFSSLDKVRLENYIRDILRDPEVPSTDEQWLTRLLGLGFLTENAIGTTSCTIAGLVLFGIKPRQFLRQSGIRMMAFKGVDMEYQALTDQVLDGPMVGRWLVEEGKRKYVIDSGIIEKFIDHITPFITEEASELDENMRRVTQWVYPYEAVRETVINALAHRDWTCFVDIEVTGYSNRLEIISPGALRNSMTVEKMIAGQRSTRNQIIVEVLRDYGYVDARGMGVRTKVIPSMKAEGKVPKFEVTEDYVKTILQREQQDLYSQGNDTGYELRDSAALYTVEPIKVKEARELVSKGTVEIIQNATIKDADRPVKYDYASTRPCVNAFWVGDASLSSLKKEILSLISLNSDICYDKLAELTGKNRTTVMRNIQKLKELGILRRVGSRKTGRWEIVRKD